MTPPDQTPDAQEDTTETAATTDTVDSTDGPEADAAAAREATKAKFRDALAQKHARRGEDHIDLDPHQSGAHGPVNEKRTFRRKTG